MTDDEVATYKYHSAQCIALSSGEVAMVGPFTNSEGLPLVSTFSSFEELHAALHDFQTRPWRHRYEPQAKAQVSLESLGLVRPMKRRSLNGTST